MGFVSFHYHGIVRAELGNFEKALEIMSASEVLAVAAVILHSLVNELTSNDPHPEKGMGKHCSVGCMTLGRQRQEDFRKFNAGLVYTVSPSIAKVTWGNPSQNIQESPCLLIQQN